MSKNALMDDVLNGVFQSPKSGKFESNPLSEEEKVAREYYLSFQSPKSGKFESNGWEEEYTAEEQVVSIP